MRTAIRKSNSRCSLLPALTLAALALIGSGSASAAPGGLDSSVWTGGLLTQQLSATDDAAHAVLTQPDGKFIVVGSGDPAPGYGGYSVARYNASGTLDSSFGGGDGLVLQATGQDGEATAAALQPDGKIVVGGTFWNGPAAMEQFSFMRFNSDGTLDASFGSGGVVQVGFGSFGDYLQGIAIDSLGRIVGTGIMTTNIDADPDYDRAVMATARLTSTGALDTTFDADGKVTTVLGGTSIFDKSRAIAIDSSDRPVIAGDTYAADDNFDDFVVVRYTTSGALDTSFNGTGKQIVKIGSGTHDDGRSIAIQPDGKILAAGLSNNENRFAVIRLTTGGALDTSFASTGKFETALAGFSTAGANAIRVQQNGRIVVGGFADDASASPRFALVRVTSAGVLDSTFGTGGIVTTNVGGPAEDSDWFCDQTAPQCPGIHGLGILNDGDLIGVGAKRIETNTDFQLARYDGDVPTLPTVSIASPANASTTGSSAIANFTTTTPGGVALKQVTCQLDSNAPAICATGQSYSGLAVGAHTITVRATDFTGITGSSSVSFTTGPAPVVAITAPVEGATLAGTSTSVTFSTTGSPTSVTCALDAGAATACSSGQSYSGLAPGLHYVTVTATNATGSDAKVVNFSVVDNTAPTAPTGVAATGITTGSATINWSASTDNVGVTGYEVFRGATSLGTTAGTNLAITGLACSTTYSITVRARDASGNWSAASTAYSLTTTTCPAPVVTITSPTAAQAFAETTTSVTLNFTATGSPTSTTCKLDAGAPGPCTTGQTFGGLAQGPHSILVSATNVGGTATATVNFRIVDNQAPTAPSALTTSNITQTGVRLTWTASADNVGVEQYNVTLLDALGGVKWIGYTNTASVPMTQFDLPTNVDPSVTDAGLTCGTQYWLRLDAEDNATNIAGAPARNNSANSIDKEFFTLPCDAAPTVTISSPVNASTLTGYNTAINFSATGYPATFTYTCKLDAAAAAACATGQAYVALAPGSHTVVVTATNTTGSGSATVSFTVPDITVPSAPTGLVTSAPSPTGGTLSWAAASDNVAVTGYDVFVNGTLKGSTTGATSLAITGLACETTFSLTVRAKDQAGNSSAASSVSSLTTATCPAPVVTITAPTAAQVFAGTTASVNIAFTLLGAPTSITCKLDAGAAVPCATGSSISVPTQGPHTIIVAATNSGGTGTATANFRIIDTVKPTMPTNLQATNITQTSAQFNWTASTDNVGVEQYNVELVTAGGVSFWAGFTNSTSPNITRFNYPADRDPISTAPNLSCGTEYWFRLSAEDGATDAEGNGSHNVSTTTADTSFITGACPAGPTVTISSPANNASLAGDSTTINFTGAGVPDAITFTCKLDAGTAAPCVTGQSYTSLAAGAHTVAITATNSVGSGSATVNFTVPDLLNPTAPTNISNSAVTTGSATINWTAATDNVAVTGYEIYLGAAVNPVVAVNGAATSAVIPTLTCSTAYSVTVKAKDAAGHKSPASAATNFTTLACPAPTVTITAPTADQVLAGTATTVKPLFTTTGSPTSVTCTLDNLAAAACISGQTISGLAQGPHTLTVSATSVWGTGSTTVQFSVADTIAPARPGAPTFSNVTRTAAQIDWTAASDNVGVAGYEVFFDGLSKGTITGALTFNASDLTCGTLYSVTVKATDTAGLVSLASTAGSLTTLPCPAPATVVINSPADNATIATSDATVVFTTGSDPTTVTCKLDASAAVPCSSPATFSSLAPGPHAVTVTASNALGGNSDSVVFSVADVTDPSPPGDVVVSNIDEDAAKIDWTTATDDVEVTGYEIFKGAVKIATLGANIRSYTINNLVCDTPYSITVKAVDAAGNAGAAAAPQFSTLGCPAPPLVAITNQPVVTNGNAIHVEFALSGGAAKSVTCQLDQAAATACTTLNSTGGSIDYSSLAPGPHLITIAARNSNSDPGTATVNFTVSSPTAPPIALPAASPAIKSAPKSVKAGKSIALRLACPTGCTVSAVLKLGKKSVKLKSIAAKANQGTLTIKLSSAVTKKITLALKKRIRVSIVFTPSGGGAPKSVAIK